MNDHTGGKNFINKKISIPTSLISVLSEVSEAEEEVPLLQSSYEACYLRTDQLGNPTTDFLTQLIILNVIGKRICHVYSVRDVRSICNTLDRLTHDVVN